MLALGGLAIGTLRHDPLSDHRLSSWHSLARPLDLRRRWRSYYSLKRPAASPAAHSPGSPLAVILYTRFAEYMPGIFYSKSPSWARIASYLYLDSNGMLGLPLDVAAGVVVAFILLAKHSTPSAATNFSPTSR